MKLYVTNEKNIKHINCRDPTQVEAIHVPSMKSLVCINAQQLKPIDDISPDARSGSAVFKGPAVSTARTLWQIAWPLQASEVPPVEASDYLYLTILIIPHLNSSWPHHTTMPRSHRWLVALVLTITLWDRIWWDWQRGKVCNRIIGTAIILVVELRSIVL